MKRYLLPASVILLLGCGHKAEQYVLPDQVTDFTALYENNCAGCHGPNGRSGAARPLNDPVFLAVIGKQTLRDIIAKGVPKTAMPAFGQSAGGGLTDQQIMILTDHIEQEWSRPQDFTTVALPRYSTEPGDPKLGEAVFREYCERCHGEDGTGDARAKSVVNPAFLALVSDQSLRTTVIAGRADQGSPDYRNDSPGHPMTSQEVSDVVAWLATHRLGLVTLTQRGTKLP